MSIVARARTLKRKRGGDATCCSAIQPSDWKHLESRVRDFQKTLHHQLQMCRHLKLNLNVYIQNLMRAAIGGAERKRVVAECKRLNTMANTLLSRIGDDIPTCNNIACRKGTLRCAKINFYEMRMRMESRTFEHRPIWTYLGSPSLSMRRIQTTKSHLLTERQRTMLLIQTHAIGVPDLASIICSYVGTHLPTGNQINSHMVSSQSEHDRTYSVQEYMCPRTYLLRNVVVSSDVDGHVAFSTRLGDGVFEVNTVQMLEGVAPVDVTLDKKSGQWVAASSGESGHISIFQLGDGDGGDDDFDKLPIMVLACTRKQSLVRWLDVGRLLVSCDQNRVFNLCVWNTVRGHQAVTECVCELVGHRRRIRSMLVIDEDKRTPFSSQKRIVVSGDEGGRVLVWRVLVNRIRKNRNTVRTMSPVQELKGHTAPIIAIHHSPRTLRLVTVDRTQALVWRHRPGHGWACVSSLQFNTTVRDVGLLSSGSQLVYLSDPRGNTQTVTVLGLEDNIRTNILKLSDRASQIWGCVPNETQPKQQLFGLTIGRGRTFREVRIFS